MLSAVNQITHDLALDFTWMLLNFETIVLLCKLMKRTESIPNVADLSSTLGTERQSP